jgi:hypothetical protein
LDAQLQGQRSAIVAAAAIFLCAATSDADAPARFTARLADHTRIDGELLSDWHKPELAPRLDGQPLMDSNRPAMWLLNRRLAPSVLPPAFVEMHSGDCLPGVAIDYHSAGPSDVVQTGDYWIVRPTAHLHPPRPIESPRIRVIAGFVRRIVWQLRSTSGYEPSTVLLRDGRRLSFRTIRIREGEIALLQAEGIRRLSFGELAELHMPAVDYWSSAILELAILTPGHQSRLVQFETDDGLIATGSFERFAAFAWGSERVSDQWSHGVQPAWSLDLLWVPHARIRVCRSFAPNQIPLTRIPVTEQRQMSESAAVFWPARRDRNVRGGPLRSSDLDFGWGFGVHARSRLTFPLPPEPSRFRCDFALDRIAQGSGCVRARVAIGTGAFRTLHESPPRTGSDAVSAIGPIPLPAGETLMLEVDPAHAERPVGADPFAVRDLANWLDPILELDASAWKRRTEEQTPRQFRAWDGWTVRAEGQVQWPSRMRESHVTFGSFVRCVEVRDRPLVLSRQAKLVPGRNFLVIAVSRTGDRENKSSITLHADGQDLAEREIPYRDSWQAEVAPLVFPLTDSAAGDATTVELEIRQAATSSLVPVFWEGIMITDQLPMIRCLFEDDGPLRRRDNQRLSVLVEEPHYTGVRAIAVPADGGCAWRLDPPLAIRERPRWGEFRFLRFVVRKDGGGRLGMELSHAESATRPARYDAGLGEPVAPGSKRVWDRALNDQWAVITRDVYADFGELDVEEIVLGAADGQAAYVDHVYAARSGNDFQYLPE